MGGVAPGASSDDGGTGEDFEAHAFAGADRCFVGAPEIREGRNRVAAAPARRPPARFFRRFPGFPEVCAGRAIGSRPGESAPRFLRGGGRSRSRRYPLRVKSAPVS